MAKKQPREQDGKFGVVHGGRSTGIRKKYSDKRTEEGKELEQVVGAIVSDFGGLDELTGEQMTLLLVIQEKLKVVLPVQKWLEEQMGNIIKNDKLLPVLEKGYHTWLNSLEKTLARLYATLDTNRPMMTLEKHIELKKIEPKESPD